MYLNDPSSEEPASTLQQLTEACERLETEDQREPGPEIVEAYHYLR